MEKIDAFSACSTFSALDASRALFGNVSVGTGQVSYPKCLEPEVFRTLEFFGFWNIYTYTLGIRLSPNMKFTYVLYTPSMHILKTILYSIFSISAS